MAGDRTAPVAEGATLSAGREPAIGAVRIARPGRSRLKPPHSLRRIQPAANSPLLLSRAPSFS
jgi:hypothetical protein